MPRARCCVVESVRLDQPRRGALLRGLRLRLVLMVGPAEQRQRLATQSAWLR